MSGNSEKSKKSGERWWPATLVLGAFAAWLTVVAGGNLVEQPDQRNLIEFLALAGFTALFLGATWVSIRRLLRAGRTNQMDTAVRR